jgi:hypothetical protein
MIIGTIGRELVRRYFREHVLVGSVLLRELTTYLFYVVQVVSELAAF